MMSGGAMLWLLSVHALGCDGEVIRTDSGAQGGRTSAGGEGGAEGVPEPERKCAELGLIMMVQPRCSKEWNQAGCERDLRYAIEHGCVTETVTSHECSAITCEDADACRVEIDAFVRCWDDLNH